MQDPCRIHAGSMQDFLRSAQGLSGHPRNEHSRKPGCKDRCILLVPVSELLPSQQSLARPPSKVRETRSPDTAAHNASGSERQDSHNWTAGGGFTGLLGYRVLTDGGANRQGATSRYTDTQAANSSRLRRSRLPNSATPPLIGSGLYHRHNGRKY